tara:strand:+ start:434 stop:586 length:153 start_codon:yes stop_codon:yes gene_type:complete
MFSLVYLLGLKFGEKQEKINKNKISRKSLVYRYKVLLFKEIKFEINKNKA